MAMLKVHSHAVHCKAVLFDKDGTLFHFLQLWGKWGELLVSRIDNFLKETTAAETWSSAYPTLLGITCDEHGNIINYDRTGPFAMGTEQEMTALLAWRLYEAGIGWDEAIKLITQFSSEAMRESKPFRTLAPLEGTSHLLHGCKEAGLLLGVVTSDGTRQTRNHLEDANLASYFDCIIGRDRVGKGKPNPEMVMLACQELGVSPSEVVVIGDSNADMMMGRAAGVQLNIGVAAGAADTAFLRDADCVIDEYSSITVEAYTG